MNAPLEYDVLADAVAGRTDGGYLVSGYSDAVVFTLVESETGKQIEILEVVEQAARLWLWAYPDLQVMVVVVFPSGRQVHFMRDDVEPGCKARITQMSVDEMFELRDRGFSVFDVELPDLEIEEAM